MSISKVSRRSFLQAIGLYSAVTVFSACSDSSTATSSTSSSTTSTATTTDSSDVDIIASENIEIRMASTATAGTLLSEVYTELLDNFVTEYPNVEISFEALTSSEIRTKLSVEFAANTPPDITWIPSNYAREYIGTGQLLALNDVVEADEEMQSWFSDAMWDNVTSADGEIMFMPLELAYDSLYYNKSMFAEHGWNLPTTFDELMDLFDEINAAGISPMTTGGADTRFAWQASVLLLRAGGAANYKALTIGDALTEWDNPDYGFVTAMEKFKEMVDSDCYYQGVLGLTMNDSYVAFTNGEVAMCYEGAWMPSSFETYGGTEFLENVGRINFPAMTDCPNGSPDCCVGGCGVGWACASGLPEAKQAACIEILKRIMCPDTSIPLLEANASVYCGNCDYDESKLSTLMNEVIAAAKASTEFVGCFDVSAAPAIDLAIKGTACPGIITGEYTPEQAAAEVQKAAEAYVAALV
ncbi:MAG: extracellular solute-binding protein [Faecalibacterium sp.]